MDELMNLLSQLRPGPAARAIYELVTDLDGETLTARQIEQEIRNVLALHGASACTDAVIAALAEVGFAGLRPAPAADREVKAAASASAGWLDIDSGICIGVHQHGAGAKTGH